MCTQNGAIKMKKMKSILMLTVGLSVTCAVLSASSVSAKTLWLDEDDYRTLEQGDGDYEPTNINVKQEEVSLQVKAPTTQVGTQTASAMQVTAQEKIVVEVPAKEPDPLPTLTQEGGFLLPTYVLPEAREAKQTTVTSVDASNPWRQTEKTTTTHTRRTFVKGSATLPSVQTTQRTQTSNAREAELLANIEKQYQQTAALLESTSQRLTALEAGVENLAQKPQMVAQQQQPAPYMLTQNTMQGYGTNGVGGNGYGANGIAGNGAGGVGTITVTRTEQQQMRREPLLLPLAPARSVPMTDMEDADERVAAAGSGQGQSRVEYVDYILSIIKRNSNKKVRYSESDELILRSIPKEMKISFLPDTADLSDQAFKWIKVFAYNPMRSVANAVEIRLSAENLDLQSRRFALIKGVLLSNGVAARQIRFVFTDRDPDTIILRDVVLQDDVEYITKTQKNGKTSQQIIQKW